MLRQYILLDHWLRRPRNERGATAVEYGLMVALIAVAIIVVVAALGDNLSSLFNKVNNKVVEQNAKP